MIIARAPFRVSFCGGGSDISSFYQNHGGCVISTTINKYVYLSAHPTFMSQNIILKYSQSEVVRNPGEIQHSIFRQVLSDMDIRGVEIDSQADIPTGTGLGSSSSFTVCLLHLLNAYKGKLVSKEYLASEACNVEIEKLKNPIGKQDQYAAAYGGMNYYKFNKDGSVYVEPLLLTHDDRKYLEDHIMMFYTGKTRSASDILKEQKSNIGAGGGQKEKNQLELCRLTEQLKDYIVGKDFDKLGGILDESWKLKRSLASGISNREIDDMYSAAMEAGALGGKLLGAGGGGFLLFYVKPQNKAKVRSALSGLPYMRFGFDTKGSCILYVGDNFRWEENQ